MQMKAHAIRKAILVCVFLWVAVILIISGPYILCSETEDQVVARLTHAIKELETLKQQNHKLRLALNSLKLPLLNSDKDLDVKEIQEKLSKATQLIEQNLKEDASNAISLWEGEIIRRRVSNGVQEMWYRIRSELSKFNNSQTHKAIIKSLDHLSDYKRTILNDLNLYEHIDILEDWRKREAEELSALIQKRLHKLQNPPNCSKARKLVCSLNKGCGYGCQIHHVVYCFIVAYGTERTLILRSQNWRYAPYSDGGWESVFLPLSETCTSDEGASRSSWPGSEDTQVVDLPIVDNVRPRPAFLPLALPADLKTRLSRLHGNPPVWWLSQFLLYMLRPQPSLKEFLDQAETRIGFKHPIVGVHVRRTDKIGTEAAFHPIEEYMEHVEDFFKQKSLNSDTPVQRIVYLATDDPNLLAKAKQKYPHYQFLGDRKIAQSASLTNRYSKESLRGIILDIHMLSKCDYLVCTFSSQVCRLAYEIMQTLHPDASSYYKSLDDIFYFGGQNDHNQQAIYDHKAESPDEIDVKKGDLLGIAGNHWDGFSKGVNRRTQRSGLYPSYKAVEKLEWVEMPTYGLQS